MTYLVDNLKQVMKNIAAVKEKIRKYFVEEFLMEKFKISCRMKNVIWIFRKNKGENQEIFSFPAVRTGLEPATPCVTGMYSNQLNYRTFLRSATRLSAELRCKDSIIFYTCKA